MEELPESMLMQMIGRAGRRPHEQNGRAYILTKMEHIVSKTPKRRVIVFQIMCIDYIDKLFENPLFHAEMFTKNVYAPHTNYTHAQEKS